MVELEDGDKAVDACKDDAGYNSRQLDLLSTLETIINRKGTYKAPKVKTPMTEMRWISLICNFQT